MKTDATKAMIGTPTFKNKNNETGIFWAVNKA
jgi:hypothetical protein